MENKKQHKKNVIPTKLELFNALIVWGLINSVFIIFMSIAICSLYVVLL